MVVIRDSGWIPHYYARDRLALASPIDDRADPRMQQMSMYLQLSERIASWTRGAEALALMRAAYALPDGAIIVELGSFLGSGTILLAGARKLRRSGQVHCVDPFDASGDSFSVQEYERILGDRAPSAQLQKFRANLRNAGLARWVHVHQGRAEDVASRWSLPLDLLFMDGDQSPAGVESAFTAWAPWLKPDAVLALHNSIPREYAPEHDGHFRLRERLLGSGEYVLTEVASSTSFLRRPAA
jgi:predicted O-methyltransferase YrrM